jgi:small subunit ribosomal protein S1
MVEDAVESLTDALNPAATKKKVVGPTRFDRLKALYKGPKFVPAENEDIPFSYEDFAEAVSHTQYSFERNSVVQGMAVEYSSGGCLVDIGAKASAYLPPAEVSMNSDQPVEAAIPLDVMRDFQIISEEDENGQLLVSVKRIEFKRAWDSVVQLASEDAVLEANVVAVNRGGAICMIEGLRAFLPGSHLAGQLPDESLIGQALKVKFLEVNPESGKLVVSNRKAVVEQRMADFSRGDVVTGVVKALKPYGAFVEVGGVSCLLHISQISQDHIRDLEKVLQPGMTVKAMIIDHDKVNGRIALNTKYLEYEAGMMLTNAQAVFDKAEETAIAYHKKMEEERERTQDMARDIVLDLGSSLDDGTVDPLQDVSDSLDSLLS